MNNRYFLIVVLSACMSAAVAQTSILLTGEKEGSDNRVEVSNYQVGHVGDQTMVSLDFVLDSLRVPSNRYRAFTPVIKSKDGSQERHECDGQRHSRYRRSLQDSGKRTYREALCPAHNGL